MLPSNQYIRLARDEWRTGGVQGLLAACGARLCRKVGGSVMDYIGVGHIPRGIVNSIPEKVMAVNSPEGVQCAAPHESLGESLVSISEVRPAGVVCYDLAAHLPPCFRRHFAFAPRHIYQLRNAVVAVRSGLVTVSGHVLLESSGSLFGLLSKGELDSRLSGRPKDFAVSSPVTCLPITGYYHFMFEQVPRLVYVLRHYPDTVVLMAEGEPPRYVTEVMGRLRDAGLLRSEPVLSRAQRVHVADYVFTAGESASGFTHPVDINLVRQLWPDPEPGAVPTESIYVSRRRASRSFSNEDEVEAWAAGHGISVIYPEEHSLLEQIELFRNARVVIAAHGAGLTNITWCRAGAMITEVFPCAFVNDVYARLAVQMGLDYRPLWASPDGTWGAVDLQELQHAATRLGA